MGSVSDKITVKRKHSSCHDIILEESTVIHILFSKILDSILGQHNIFWMVCQQNNAEKACVIELVCMICGFYGDYL
jgi:hypothetical protein